MGKEVNGKLTEGFLYDGQLNPVAETDATGQIVEQFIYGTRPNVPDYIIKSGVEYRVIPHQVGSPVLIVNASTGMIAEQISYDAWGNVTSDSNPGFQPFGFAGGLYDQDTKLLRFGKRDYDAYTGRWTSKDPLIFAGGETSLYGYAGNDPVNFLDPTGLYCWSAQTIHILSWAVGGAVGGAVYGATSGGLAGAAAGALGGLVGGGLYGYVSSAVPGATGQFTGSPLGGLAEGAIEGGAEGGAPGAALGAATGGMGGTAGGVLPDGGISAISTGAGTFATGAINGALSGVASEGLGPGLEAAGVGGAQAGIGGVLAGTVANFLSYELTKHNDCGCNK